MLLTKKTMVNNNPAAMSTAKRNNHPEAEAELRLNGLCHDNAE